CSSLGRAGSRLHWVGQYDGAQGITHAEERDRAVPAASERSRLQQFKARVAGLDPSRVASVAPGVSASSDMLYVISNRAILYAVRGRDESTCVLECALAKLDV
ncbi:unnamed protein product, partial [Ectocarpus sp. 12 AP-2014]